MSCFLTVFLFLRMSCCLRPKAKELGITCFITFLPISTNALFYHSQPVYVCLSSIYLFHSSISLFRLSIYLFLSSISHSYVYLSIYRFHSSISLSL